MAGEDLLFVYGSLRKGAAFEKADLLAGRAAYRGPAVATGHLYRIDWYPGFVPGTEGRVIGDLFALRDAALLVALDAYEGCAPADPAPQEYRRDRITVQGDSGPILAWVP